MKQQAPRTPLLVGMKNIVDRFEITRETFYVFLAMGLPVRKINGRWYGHEDNINEFLRKKTLGPPIEATPRIDMEIED